MDEQVAGQAPKELDTAAVTIAGTGYAFRQGSLRAGAVKSLTRPEGGMFRAVNSMYIIGALTEDSHKTMRKVSALLGAIYGWMMMMVAVQKLVQGRKAILAAMAAVETTAMAIAQQWHAIALAAIAATSVAVGLKFGSGDWKFPGINIDNHHESRKAVREAYGEYHKGYLEA